MSSTAGCAEPAQPVRTGDARRLRRKHAVVAALAVATLSLAACGSDGQAKTVATASPTSPSPTPTPLTAKQVFDIASNGTVQLHGKYQSGNAGGTGILLDDQGHVLTNAHVVDGLSALKARVGDQPEVPAQILGMAPCEDMAVVKMTHVPTGSRPLELGDSDKVQNQDEVTALGFPNSFADPTTQKVVSTIGTVQSPNVSASPALSLPKYPSTIQHSATINPGNSGGPLLDSSAKVIGMNSLGNTGRVQGQFYAISSDRLKQFIPQLKAGKKLAYAGWDLYALDDIDLSEFWVEDGWGDAAGGQTNERLAEELCITGLYVRSVADNSPAANAGVEAGDVIAKINGNTVETVADVCDHLQSAAPGGEVKIISRYLFNWGKYKDKGVTFGDAWSGKMILSK